MVKYNYVSHVGVGKGISTTSHKLSNNESHCGSYACKLHTNSHTKFTSPVATPDSTPAAAKPRPVGGPPAGKGGTNSVIKGSGGPKG